MLQYYLIEYSRLNGELIKHYDQQNTHNLKIIDNEQYLIIIDGDVYNLDFSILSDVENTLLYFGKNENHLDGDYSIFIYSKENKNLFISTDFTASKKIFYSSSKDKICFSNSIYLLVTPNYRINRLGLAQFLANGFTFLGSTLVENISMMQYGTLMKILLSSIKEIKYWSFNFSSEITALSKETLEEFDELYQNAIMKRVCGKNLISLSGGYESTSHTLMLLRNKIKFDTFTYCGRLSNFIDKKTVKKQIKYLNISNKMLRITRKKALSFYLKNALLGMGTAKVCEELNIVYDLKKVYSKVNTIFGEECFGITKRKNDILSNIHLYNGKHIYAQYKNIIQKDLLLELSKLLDENIDKLLNDNHDMTYDKKVDKLFFEIQTANVFTGWRYFYWNSFFKTVNPLLDKEIILFVSKLSDNLRNKKRLFIIYNNYFNEKFYRDIKRAGAKNYLGKIDLFYDSIKADVSKTNMLLTQYTNKMMFVNESKNISKYFYQIFMHKMNFQESYQSYVSEFTKYERLKYFDIFKELIQKFSIIKEYNTRIKMIKDIILG